MSTSSINFHSKKVRERYISHTALLVIIILLIIITIFYYYEKEGKKYKMENNEVKRSSY